MDNSASSFQKLEDFPEYTPEEQHVKGLNNFNPVKEFFDEPTLEHIVNQSQL